MMKLSDVFKTVAIAGFLAFSAQSASAVTVGLRLTDLGADGIFGTADDITVTIADDGIGDTVAGLGQLNFSGSIGAFNLTINTITTEDANGNSSLTLNTTTFGSGLLLVEATGIDFGAGAGSPTTAVADASASDNPGQLTYNAAVDAANALFGAGTAIFAPAVTTSGGEQNVDSVDTVLVSPFSITSSVLIDTRALTSNTKTAFDVTVDVSQVPVPAGILLMGTALAGFGVMRRRKKRA